MAKIEPNKEFSIKTDGKNKAHDTQEGNKSAFGNFAFQIECSVI